MVPVANIGSKLSWVIIMVSFIVGLSTTLGMQLLDIGIIAFGAVVLFQLITLPVEFNASSRALDVLGDYGIMGSQEISGGRRVLNAAALTYVAAAATAILQLLRLLLLRNSRR
jgi:Zn-dependent membrane protease YugP